MKARKNQINFNVQTLPAHRICWVGRVGFAELSELQAEGFTGGQVFNDSADLGFKVEGKKETVYFAFTRTHKSKDGEIGAYIFQSVYPRTAAKKFEIYVFND
jgi:hypothetical protein